MHTSRATIPKQYSIQENHVWNILYTRQMERVQHTDAVHSMIKQGYANAQLPHDHCPNALQMSKKLKSCTGWQITDAKNTYLSDQDRYHPIYDKYFPATNYIRPMDELDFTPLPDLAHDYFGHMPLMFHPQIAPIQRDFAWMYFHANESQKKDIYNFARYVIEYSIVKEQGKPKIFGAGLLSSPGDFQRFIDHKFQLLPAHLESIIKTDRSPYQPHQQLFVYESFEDMCAMIQTYQQYIQSHI